MMEKVGNFISMSPTRSHKICHARSILIKHMRKDLQHSEEIKPSALKSKLIGSKCFVRYEVLNDHQYENISESTLTRSTNFNYFIKTDPILVNMSKPSGSLSASEEFEFLQIVFDKSDDLDSHGSSSCEIITKRFTAADYAPVIALDANDRGVSNLVDIVVLISEETQVVIDQYPVRTKHSFGELICIPRPLLEIIDNSVEFNGYDFYNKLSINAEVCDKLPVISLLGVTAIAYQKKLHSSFLIYGNSNTGKSTLVHGIADRYNMQIVHFCICDLIQCGREYADKRLVEVCNMVIALQCPCILVVDDMDSILLSDTDTGEEQEIGSLMFEKFGELVEYFARMNQRYESSEGTHSGGDHPYIWLFGISNACDEYEADAGGKQPSWLSTYRVRRLFPDEDQVIHLSAKYPSSPYERRSIISKLITFVGPYCSHMNAGDYSKLTNDLISLVEDAVESHNSKSVDGAKLTGISFVLYCYEKLHEIGVLHLGSTAGGRNEKRDAIQNLNRTKNKGIFDTTESVHVVHGHDAIKEELYDAILLPKMFYNTFRKYHCKLEIGVLLYGPPGTGKTLLTKTLALQSNYAFLCVRLTDIIKGEVGTGEHILLNLFKSAKQSQKQTIIFIDEFQSLFTAKKNADGEATSSSLTSTLMSCLDEVVVWNTYAGPNNLITVIAATNEPWAVDASFLRPGRFDRCLYVGTLGATARERMIVNSYMNRIVLDQNLDDVPAVGADIPLTEFEIKFLVDATDGFTGADIDNLIRKSKILAVQEILHPPSSGMFNFSVHQSNSDSVSTSSVEDKPVVCFRHWVSALQSVTPSVSVEDIELYKGWHRETDSLR